MKLKKQLQKWIIPEISQSEIEATFQKCLPYLNKIETHKLERSEIKKFRNYLRYSKKTWFLLELFLSVVSFIFMKIIVEDYRLLFLSFISVLFATLLLLEWYRNLNYNTWEIEKTCSFSTEKVMLYKLLLMGMFHLICFTFLSLYTSMISSIAFVTVLCYGAFPFFATIGFTLQLSSLWKDHSSLFVGFMSGNIGSYICVSYLLDHTTKGLLLFLTLVTVVYFTITTHHYFQTMEKERGSLLWS